jgi:hypothetical protein
MRKIISVFACLFIFVSLPVCAQPQDTKSKYDILLHSLINRVKSKDPLLMDEKAASKAFEELRFAYTETPQYNPYAGIKSEAGGAMITAISNKEYTKALKYAERILKEDYVDIDAHMVAATAYRETGNQEEADYHQAIASILLQSILRNGYGDKLKTAIEVISVDEEYVFLSLAGLRMKSQAELHENGHNYDKLTVYDSVSGKTFEIFFGIDRPFNWLQNSFKKSM